MQASDGTKVEQYSGRNRLIKELTSQGITFDHYGNCKFGTDSAARQLPAPHIDGYHQHGRENQMRKVQIMRRYKFVLGLENIVQFDYVTEKFYHMFATGCVLLSP